MTFEVSVSFKDLNSFVPGYLFSFINISVDKAYGNWGSWNDCNASCGDAMRKRERVCKLKPEYPPVEKLLCISPAKDYQYISCFIQPCRGEYLN